VAEERLQKILARAGVASRRKAEELIEAGLVTVNGRVAVLGDKADAASDAIKVEGRRVPAAVPQRYVLVNKPAGFVSTVSDPEGRPTVLDLVHPALRKALKPVGRLDFQSEGLLLLTTDGEWAQRIAHPRYGCAKVYEAKVKGVPEERVIERLRRGMWIEGKRTMPAEVELLRTTARGREEGNSWWEVVLREGRSRQIREMFFRVGHGVLKLRRVAIGPLRDEELPLGGYRELEEGEVEALRKAGKTTAREQGRRAAVPGVPRGRSRRAAARGGAGRASAGEHGAGGARSRKPPRGGDGEAATRGGTGAGRRQGRGPAAGGRAGAAGTAGRRTAGEAARPRRGPAEKDRRGDRRGPGQRPARADAAPAAPTRRAGGGRRPSEGPAAGRPAPGGARRRGRPPARRSR
jgi:23S rRNA pseudouridine2605 synthase